MSRVEKPQEIAAYDIHDNPLLHYPHVIVTLMKQRAIMIRVACDTVRIADGLRELAEAEARRRAKARAALSLTKGRDYDDSGQVSGL